MLVVFGRHWERDLLQIIVTIVSVGLQIIQC